MHKDSLLPAGKVPGQILDRLLRTYRTRPDASVLVDASYGFDAAAIRVGVETLLVKSDPITFATSDAAMYLVAVNANDVSCLGGVPRWMTVVALLPEGSTTPESIEKQFADLQRACDAEGVSLIGGHTEITPGIDRPLLIGTMIGTVGPSGFLQPGKARAGDDLWLSHSAGIEGTALLAHEKSAELRTALGDDLVDQAQYLLTEPGISVSKTAQALLGTGRITALHDPTEGGVATAIHEIAAASELGADVDGTAIPVRESTAAICAHFGMNPLGLLSSGALLFATPPNSDELIHATGVPASRIGVLTNSQERLTITTERGEESLPRFDSDEFTRAFVD